MILYQGLLASPASWARVGRGYVGAFLELGVEVRAVATRGFGYDAGFPLPEGLEVISAGEARRSPPPPIGLGFLHPPLLRRLVGRYKANLLVWESDRIPGAWRHPLECGVDAVIVPSRFTRDALLASGFPAEKVKVAPYGHRIPPSPRDPARSSSGVTPFTFLSVAAPHWRKGVRELLCAYRSAFTCRDPVRLYIKSTYDPAQRRRRFRFEIPSWERLLADCGLRAAGAPKVDLDLRTLPEEEMVSLHRQAQVYVAPTWGESFGLAILDAAAAASPVIATGWGGHTEYVSPGPDLVPFALRDGDGFLYECAPGARVAVPEAEALAARMRWHYENPAASREEGRRAQARVADWTWERAAEHLLGLLRSEVSP